MVIERYSKISVKLSELFSGNVLDQLAQKVGVRSSFRLSGLLDVIDDEVYVVTDPAKNIMVCYFLNQSIIKGYVSSTFSKVKYTNNGHIIWKQLVEQYEESK